MSKSPAAQPTRRELVAAIVAFGLHIAAGLLYLSIGSVEPGAMFLTLFLAPAALAGLIALSVVFRATTPAIAGPVLIEALLLLLLTPLTLLTSIFTYGPGFLLHLYILSRVRVATAARSALVAP